MDTPFLHDERCCETHLCAPCLVAWLEQQFVNYKEDQDRQAAVLLRQLAAIGQVVCEQGDMEQATAQVQGQRALARL